jgi:hypothetical protein
MSENRNVSSYIDGRGTVCIDTQRVLDSCRDRDCFENTRVYLTAFGEQTLENASNIRIRSAKILWAYVGVDEVPFNCGFYQVTIRYYVETEIEACLGMGRSQTVKGLSVLEKDVILYGGEGSVTTFSSDPENRFCAPFNSNNKGSTDPVAIAETVEPIVLGNKIVDCSCPCAANEFVEVPECVCGCFDGDIVVNPTDAKRLYVSFGVFSVIRISRPAQLLVQATDYSVPDKECVAATNDENPCALFNSMAFPTNRFRATMCAAENDTVVRSRGGSGCGK